jgi:hypothetical protein
MVTTLNRRSRALLVGGCATLVLAAGAVPAWADAPMPGSANDTVMSTGQAILVFLGIPAVVVALVYLLVSAPGWTRGGRADATEAWTGEPLVVGADQPAAVEAPAATSADATSAEAPAVQQAAGQDEPAAGTGGTSASW